MRRAAWVCAVAVLLAGCGVGPSGVLDGGPAPTGVAPGVTLYFLDADQRLQPQQRATDRLGTVSSGVSLLLTGPGPGSGLHTQIAPVATTRVEVTTAPGLLRLVVPLAASDVGPSGVDQIVCTALGVHVQGGGDRGTRVQIRFTLPAPGSDEPRTCPLTG
ncbi:hypothetical protein [Pseudonocardia humida]|uniref:Lipoprotein n=1 Tax=Pseudonocardia humida TaxID=2800819 RepID=A0ABT0ZZC3_9PSEU|nr:hypothetical protein [Pseudonocardia humida]MCO1656061.1 hypothetical protein [Pseudonocardia humida]